MNLPFAYCLEGKFENFADRGLTNFALPGNLTAFSPVTSLFYIITVLSQELIVFCYRIQVYCASMYYSDESAT